MNYKIKLFVVTFLTIFFSSWCSLPELAAQVTITTQAMNVNHTCSGGNANSAYQAWLANHGNAVASSTCVTNPPGYTWADVSNIPLGACVNGVRSSTVTFKVTDNIGCIGSSATTVATFRVVDNSTPSITTGAQSTAVNCDGAGNVNDLNTWLITRAGSAASDSCSATPNLTVTYRINGADVTAAQVQAALASSIASINASGSCVTMPFTFGTTTYTQVKGYVVVEFRYTDDCGKAATAGPVAFVVQDKVIPTISLAPAPLNVQCDAVDINTALEAWYYSAGGGIATDGGCSNVTLVPNISLDTAKMNLAASRASAATCGNTGFVEVSFTATDVCGNTNPNAALIKFSVIDGIGPKITGATDTITECASNTNPALNQTQLQAWLNNHAGAIASDACSSAVTWSYTWTDVNGNTGTSPTPPTVQANRCNWFVDVKFIATDECGNKSNVDSRFSLKDTQAPTFTFVPADATVSCSNIPSAGTPTASDNCNAMVVVSFTQVRTNGNCPNRYTLTRTWIATDDCNNSKTASQVITVQDNTAPLFTSPLPSNITVNCDAVPVAVALNATDNCDSGTGVFMAKETSTKGTNPNACSFFYSYAITRTWTATDACGNSTAHTQIVTVQDVTPPTVKLLADITIECSQDTTPAVTGTPSATDNCSPVIKTYKDVTTRDYLNPNNCGNYSYTITRTWTIRDVCDNFTLPSSAWNLVQTITVRDTKAPTASPASSDRTIDCTTAAAADAAFLAWVADNGGGRYTDNCSDVRVFAAVPGSYTINNGVFANNQNYTQVGGLNAPVCPSAAGVYRQETVDFIIFDRCNNALVNRATFTVRDNTPPVFDTCPKDFTVDAAAGICAETVKLVAPVISDACSNGTAVYNNTVSQAVPFIVNGDEVLVPDFSAANGNAFSFAVPAPPIGANGNATLIVTLNNIDAEEMTEYFTIIGDDGSILMQTRNTTTQCGSVPTMIMIPAATLNAWAADGIINISLLNHNPAPLADRYGINQICPNASIVTSLTYNYNTLNNIGYQYSVDGSALVAVNPIADVSQTLNVGVHSILYVATDCAGNTSACTYKITVRDVEKPLVTCPTDFAANTDLGLCATKVTLPFPQSVSDNCGFATTNQTVNQFLTYTYNPNLLAYYANNRTFNFNIVAANAIGSQATLTISLLASNAAPGGNFSIFGEGNTFLGTVTPNSCTVASSFTFNISVATFNAWAADGVVTITAIANTPTIASPGGITPCTGAGTTPVTANGGTDGKSNLNATLSYSPLSNITYSVVGATTIAATQFGSPAFSPMPTLNGGSNTVTYTVADLAGNTGICSFVVSINDNQAPKAVCADTVVYVNTNGQPTVITPSLINKNSSDNCGFTMTVDAPNTFDCTIAGTTVVVTLRVTDNSGAQSTCTALVRIETEKPLPTFKLGLCSSDTLFLFANPPTGVFTYLWSGPNGFVSALQDPKIPNPQAVNAGSYSVTITNVSFSSCSATGIVQVPITSQPNTPSISADSLQICNNMTIRLRTQPYTGANVQYQWYLGVPSTGTLVATTSVPLFNIPNPATGTFSYYVIVKIQTCVSNPSAPVSVTVSSSPTATVNPTTITICEGENIQLGTQATGVNYSYQWTGPSGFMSSAQNPTVITNAQTFQGGNYNLIIKANGCASLPATTAVTVNPRPAKPLLSSVFACIGDNLTLTTNIPNGNSYEWTAPNLATYMTSNNSLTLVATASMKGNWRVSVTRNGCKSETSDLTFVDVEPKPVVLATYQSPVCNNSTIKLLSGAAQNGVNLVWTNGLGLIVGTGSNIEIPAPTTAGNYTYTVTATSSFGCTSSSSVAVIVSAVPTAAVANATLKVCEASTLQLGSPSVGVGFTYQWTGPNGYTSNLQNPPVIANITPAQAGLYSLVVTNGGCNSAPASTNVTVTLRPAKPLLTSAFTCAGDTLFLTTNNNTADVYHWIAPNFTQYTSQVNRLAISPASLTLKGKWRVFVTFNGCDSEVSDETAVDVENKPVVQASYQTPVCVGTTFRLLSNLLPIGVTYTWKNAAGVTVGIGQNVDIVAPAQPGNYIYTVTVVTPNGCGSSSSVTVFVNPLPIASVAQSTVTACEGSNIQLSATSTGSGYTYQWTGPNGYSSNAQNPPILNNVTAFQGGNYQLVVSNNGCSATANTIVAINPRPAKPTVSSTFTCVGDSLILTTNIPNPSDNLIYHWTSPTFLQFTTNVNRLALIAATNLKGNWKVYISSPNGCESEASELTFVDVENKPVVQANYQNPACNNGTIKLTSNTLNGNITYVWKNANDTIVGVGQNLEIPSPVAPGNYIYSVTASTPTGCAGTSVVTVVVRQSPVITAVSNNAQQCVTGAQNIRLTPTIFPVGNGTYSYLWIGSNGFSSVDSFPVLPNGTELDNGSYTLVVTNSFGCKSAPKTNVVDVTNVPATPTISAVQLKVCEGDMIQINVNNPNQGSGVTYRWNTPIGTVTTIVPTLKINNATTLNSGDYSVLATRNSCNSLFSGIINITVTAIPDAPIVTGDSEVCAGQSIQLFAPFVTGAVYEWSGPCSFTSSVFNPVVFNATACNQGTYKVRIKINGCASPYSLDKNVTVNAIPNVPNVQTTDSVCVSTPNATVVLKVLPPGQPGVKYTWYDANTDTIVGGPVTALNFTLGNLTNYGSGVHDFYVKASQGGCSSLNANVSIQFSNVLNINANAGLDVKACNTSFATIKAETPQAGIGKWTQTSGIPLAITNLNLPTTTVTGVQAGQTYTFRWTLSNGACKDYSFDEMTVTGDVTTAIAKADSLNLCDTIGIRLRATAAPAGSVGNWTQPPTQASFGIIISNPNNPLSGVTGMIAGNTYTFRWTLSNSGCGDYSFIDVQVKIAPKPSNVAFAGADFTACGVANVILNASIPTVGTGLWTALNNQNIQIVNPTLPQTNATNLTVGFNAFIWTLSNSACGVFSRDTVIVKFNEGAVANADIALVSFAGTKVIDVISNDVLPANWTISLKTPPMHGTATNNGNGSFKYAANSNYVGNDQFVYQVCPTECPDQCSEAIVTLRIGDDTDCKIPNIITPNNDAYNDAFVVPCLATGKYPKNSVLIFNQWGDEVYRSENYQNDWTGTYKGEELPAATYFYIINFGDPTQGSKSGFLMIER